jgi:hypothetical protein
MLVGEIVARKPFAIHGEFTREVEHCSGAVQGRCIERSRVNESDTAVLAVA